MTQFQKAMLGFLFVISVCLLIITYFFISDLYAYDFEKVAKLCKDNSQSCDGIAIAYQLGRLDFVSVCLALLGVIVGLSAIFGFLSIKEKSEVIAEKVAKAEIKSFLEKDAKQIVMRKVNEAVQEEMANNQPDRTDVNDDEADWGDHL
ncbi:hypothetical protein INT50_12395 [Vibrio diabolicus]|uniref:hypothetical protein n=1 Tax=Vibrio diabolicus TaxID=50719 RepID=UPI0013E089D5|nr:hypothetical protein [Vibrio diabolicus]QOV29449.1 hypothetical protein INT50_12395 [Vibrio diabolicus]